MGLQKNNATFTVSYFLEHWVKFRENITASQTFESITISVKRRVNILKQ